MTNIQIRGTSGSGKSTLMREIIDLLDPKTMKPVHHERESIPHHYHMIDRDLIIAGPYQKPSGGLDVLGKEERRLQNLDGWYTEWDLAGLDVLSEGLLQSEATKWVNTLGEAGVRTKLVFLNTDIDLCMQHNIDFFCLR